MIIHKNKNWCIVRTEKENLHFWISSLIIKKTLVFHYRPQIMLWEIWASSCRTFLWQCKNPPLYHGKCERRAAAYTDTHWWMHCPWQPHREYPLAMSKPILMPRAPVYVDELLCRTQEEAACGGKDIKTLACVKFLLLPHQPWDLEQFTQTLWAFIFFNLKMKIEIPIYKIT